MSWRIDEWKASENAIKIYLLRFAAMYSTSSSVLWMHLAAMQGLQQSGRDV
jgi:hypothetical protein